MRMIDLIEKKREGQSLTEGEINYMIEQYTNDQIPDYQMAAMLMAIYFQDMSNEERVYLTKAMVSSGEEIDLSAIDGIKVDKHSTGGVGDSTTLILAPLVASVGVPVAKMSGRGLGHTGGTLDKLESIPGFNVELDSSTFINLVNKNKVSVIGQSGHLTPADQKLYALRDVTATVNSIPLIASSIMSKKIASGADAIVLDVKTGSGAFMKELEDAKVLAQAMVDIGNGAGRKTIALISDMNQPLGYAVGNALEIKEAIATLKGEGPDDLTELCLALGSQMVYLANQAESIDQAREKLLATIENGEAIGRLKIFIESQGGDPRIVDQPEQLPIATYQIEVKSTKAGYISEIAADQIGVAASMLGAGRTTKDSDVDLAVGVVLRKKVSDYVNEQDTLAVIHSNQTEVATVIEKILHAFQIQDQEVTPKPLIYQTIS
ncbi:pyrimidine-nucleoside phosphorylase [Amphibacillus xylanus]|uniref:Pyrimidine-nucleoside phosphorylase n=1 Tax=Amphibacillus xylanus (strain ATCC 51415 / DSM 6626 / JCM 7361 / LMG 17667 / NBRC 15112 / Ep01) TaxID=698758 RepID=K0J5X2_AMPXN|nr:pyrimidine-nucleoside phosphorylase [Amphibacillus xylanus]BAM46388.1 pyrimidine nucleoside phosphorylase [Amphibacillus xylanus NBRC 15112]